MSKSGDLKEVLFQDYIKDNLTQEQRARLLVDVIWAVEIDVFNTDHLLWDAGNEDYKQALILIKKRDSNV